MTGYGTSLSLLGLPDAGLATMTEMHLNARYIANAVAVPVIADADNGYGNAINVIRTVREYIQTGVAGIHIEDQVMPEALRPRGRPPGDPARGSGRQVHARRITRAASWTRTSSSSRAPTPAAPTGGSLDEAIRRANAYLEAGADLAFVEGPTTLDEVRRVCREVRGRSVLQPDRGVAAAHPRADARAGDRDHDHARRRAPGHDPGRVRFRASRCASAARPPRPSSASGSVAIRSATCTPSPASTASARWEERFLPREDLEKYADSIGHQPTG